MKKTDISFEKVSEEQFLKDMGKQLHFNIEDATTLSRLRMAYDMFVTPPSLATVGSAGADFVAPVSFTVPPDTVVVVPTGIRAHMPEGVFLMIAPRSSMGIKHRIRLANTIGIIDSDYYHGNNEGHIMIALENGGHEDVLVEAGDRFAQGILIPYLVANNSTTKATRDGGMGSTGR